MEQEERSATLLGQRRRLQTHGEQGRGHSAGLRGPASTMAGAPQVTSRDLELEGQIQVVASSGSGEGCLLLCAHVAGGRGDSSPFMRALPLMRTPPS